MSRGKQDNQDGLLGKAGWTVVTPGPGSVAEGGGLGRMDSMPGCPTLPVACRTEGPGWCWGQNTRAIVPAPMRDYGDNAGPTARALLSGLAQAVLI